MDRKNQIRNFIEENYFSRRIQDDDGTPLKDDESLSGMGLIDSTGVLDLVGWIEKTYGVTVADEEMRPTNLDTIAALDQFIGGKLDAKAGN